MGGQNRAAIVEETYSGFRSIYCHFDGYPDHVGLLLKKHYNHWKKVKDLIDLGNISILGEHLAPPEGQQHDFSKRVESVTLAYGRDRGEEGQGPFCSSDLDSILRRFRPVHIYVWANFRWFYMHPLSWII